MKLRVRRTDGKSGTYSQTDPRRANMLALRLDPAKLFVSGPIVIGVLNPFTLIHPDEVCWVAASGHPSLKVRYPAGVDRIDRLPRREVYEKMLDQQWPKWRANAKSKVGDLLEALVELTLRGGGTEYLHVIGRVTKASLIDQVFGQPATCAAFAPDGVLYLNPRAVLRARVYHSSPEVRLPDGVWMAEADEI
jgi:hypothetical protein